MKKIPIKNADDLNDVLSDMFQDFLFDFRDRNGLTYEATGESPLIEYEENIQWYYTKKAMMLIERWKRRMKKVFENYFPNDEFNPQTVFYKEF